MHTWYYRLNALLTLATTVLAGMCAVASLTEVLHKSNPQVSASVVQVDGLLVRLMFLIVHFKSMVNGCLYA